MMARYATLVGVRDDVAELCRTMMGLVDAKMAVAEPTSPPPYSSQPDGRYLFPKLLSYISRAISIIVNVA